MQIRLESTGVDPRIFDVTIDFTGYHKEVKYFPYYGKYLRKQQRDVPGYLLDQLLKPLKLRRISGWSIEYNGVPLSRRFNVYSTTVISDRMNKGYDVG